MKKTTISLAMLLVFVGTVAFAQDGKPTAPPPLRLRATIEAFAGNVLTVRTDDARHASVHITPKTNFAGVGARTLVDIKQNDFIGVSAVTDKNGTMHAVEIHIFPRNMRGAGEGHYQWNAGPASTMTNAAVAGIVNSADGEVFTLSYKDRMTGKRDAVKIDVAPKVPVVALLPGDASLLRPGAKVVLFARKNADGSLTAFAVVAGRNGVEPPM